MVNKNDRVFDKGKLTLPGQRESSADIEVNSGHVLLLKDLPCAPSQLTLNHEGSYDIYPMLPSNGACSSYAVSTAGDAKTAAGACCPKFRL